MTRKFSISLPDEVAAVLDGVDNASAYIAEAIRRQDRRDRTRDVFARRGVTLNRGRHRRGERAAARGGGPPPAPARGRMSIRLILDTTALTAYVGDDLRALELGELMAGVTESDNITGIPALCFIAAYQQVTRSQRDHLLALAGHDDGPAVVLPAAGRRREPGSRAGHHHALTTSRRRPAPRRSTTRCWAPSPTRAPVQGCGARRRHPGPLSGLRRAVLVPPPNPLPACDHECVMSDKQGTPGGTPGAP